MGTRDAKPLDLDELDSELKRMQDLAKAAFEADFAGNLKHWQELHVKCREDLATLVATVRDLQRNRELLIRERDEARALV